MHGSAPHRRPGLVASQQRIRPGFFTEGKDPMSDRSGRANPASTRVRYLRAVRVRVEGVFGGSGCSIVLLRE